MQVLGVRRGVTYGRWTGGPADTLSIGFDLSRAGPEIRNDPAFQALLERAGKAWSHRIADTWTTWERAAGDVKGSLLADGSAGADIQVGPDGEISTGLEIYLTAGDLPGDSAGKGRQSTTHSPGDSWEPHFGAIEIDREHLREAGEAQLFATLAHEIGHVLGSWMGGVIADHYVSYTNTATGTWSGPNVVAVHGGPASFQDAADPQAWVNGERDPLASQFDLGHSGVCDSLMAYCRASAALPALLPQAIDFAFLEDFGLDHNRGDRQAGDIRPRRLDRVRRLHAVVVPRPANRPDRSPAVPRRGRESMAQARRDRPAADRSRCLRASHHRGARRGPVRHRPLCRRVDRYRPRPPRAASRDRQRQPGARPRRP